MAKNTTRNRNRVATAQRRQQDTRDRMIEALNVSSYKSATANSRSNIAPPATYGNYRRTKDARSRALNSAYGSYKRPARSGK